MPDNETVVPLNRAFDAAMAQLHEMEARLKGGPPSGTFDGMEGRVSKLEAHMEHLQDDMREVKADLKTAIGYLSVLPQKRDLDTWRWQWLATGIAIVALTVGGITGGLALIARFAG